MRHTETSREGGTILVVVLLMSLIAAAGAFAASMLGRDVNNKLVRCLAGHEVESLAFQAVEEGHYLLAMGQRPGSRSAAAADARAAAARGNDRQFAAGWQGQAGRERIYDHQTTRFLRDSNETLYFSPRCTASTVDEASGIEVGPVEATVVERSHGALIRSADVAGGKGSPAQLAEAGLPLTMNQLRSGWGVVELACEVRCRKGRSGTVTRTVRVRKLFTVIDYAFEADKPASYAYIFPEALGRVVERNSRAIF